MLICWHQHLSSLKWADKKGRPYKCKRVKWSSSLWKHGVLLSSLWQRLLINMTKSQDFKRKFYESKCQTNYNLTCICDLHVQSGLLLTESNLNRTACSLSVLWARKWLGTPYTHSKQPRWGCKLCVCSPRIVCGKHSHNRVWGKV